MHEISDIITDQNVPGRSGVSGVLHSKVHGPDKAVRKVNRGFVVWVHDKWKFTTTTGGIGEHILERCSQPQQVCSSLRLVIINKIAHAWNTGMKKAHTTLHLHSFSRSSETKTTGVQ